MEQIPFDPYGLTKNLSKGDVSFYQGGGVTAIGIGGSCTDSRGGTTSTFWKDGKYSFEDMKAMILSNTVSRSIIEKMPFKVKW